MSPALSPSVPSPCLVLRLLAAVAWSPKQASHNEVVQLVTYITGSVRNVYMYLLISDKRQEESKKGKIHQQNLYWAGVMMLIIVR